MLPDGSKIQLDIWDTAGVEEYEAMNRNFYAGSDAAVIIYDVINRGTFGRI